MVVQETGGCDPSRQDVISDFYKLVFPAFMFEEVETVRNIGHKNPLPEGNNIVDTSVQLLVFTLLQQLFLPEVIHPQLHAHSSQHHSFVGGQRIGHIVDGGFVKKVHGVAVLAQNQSPHVALAVALWHHCEVFDSTHQHESIGLEFIEFDNGH